MKLPNGRLLLHLARDRGPQYGLAAGRGGGSALTDDPHAPCPAQPGLGHDVATIAPPSGELAIVRRPP